MGPGLIKKDMGIRNPSVRQGHHIWLTAMLPITDLVYFILRLIWYPMLDIRTVHPILLFPQDVVQMWSIFCVFFAIQRYPDLFLANKVLSCRTCSCNQHSLMKNINIINSYTEVKQSYCAAVTLRYNFLFAIWSSLVKQIVKQMSISAWTEWCVKHPHTITKAAAWL